MESLPLRLNPEQSLVVAVDFQEKLLPMITPLDPFLLNAEFLLEGASLFDIPLIVTLQYPKGLGETVPRIQKVLPQEELIRIEKTSYSCMAEPAFARALESLPQIKQVVLTGIETPICILQTALDLRDAGYEVFIPEDACAGQIPADHIRALRRLEFSGVVVTCVESILYRWCGGASHPRFKDLTRMVKNRRNALREME